MDQALNAHRRYRLAAAGAALIAAALGAASAAVAQVPDPTRPPQAVYAPTAPTASSVRPRAVPGVPQVQSILVSLRPGGRRLAIIDGKTVRQGDRVGSAVVAAIHSTEVILRRGSTMQVLKLFGPAPRGTNVQP